MRGVVHSPEILAENRFLAAPVGCGGALDCVEQMVAMVGADGQRTHRRRSHPARRRPRSRTRSERSARG
jgi:hypothetical protein